VAFQGVAQEGNNGQQVQLRGMSQGDSHIPGAAVISLKKL
jgi:hypothetical protein